MKNYLTLTTLLILAACGGGGSSSPVSPVVLAPTVSVNLSSQKAKIGEAVTLSWSSTNATSCTGGDGLNGVQANTGKLLLTPAIGGQFKYSLTCSGTGGTVTGSQTLIVPLKVWPTSYENRMNIKLDEPGLPNAYSLGLISSKAEPDGTQWIHTSALSWADFTQEGKPTAFAVQLRYDPTKPKSPSADGVGGNAAGRVLFIEKNGNTYTDITSKLIKDTNDRLTCRSPRISLIADFNGDGKPDIFLGCHGIDYEVLPYNRENQVDYQFAFMSQPDGSYKRWKSDYTGYGHGASAADLNGDGKPDIVVTNTMFGEGDTILTLINNGDGTFTKAPSRFNIKNKAVYTVELIDLGRGIIDAVVGGIPASPESRPDYFPNAIIRNNGSGNFDTQVVIPTLVSAKSGANYDLLLDVVFRGGQLYFSQVGNDYKDSIIRKMDVSSMFISTIWEKLTPFSDRVPADIDFGYVNQMYFASDGMIRSMTMCDMPITDVRFASSLCGLRIKF